MERGLDRAGRLGINTTHDTRGRALAASPRRGESPGREECKEDVETQNPVAPEEPDSATSSSSSSSAEHNVGGFFGEAGRGGSLQEHLNRLNLSWSSSLEDRLRRLSLDNVGARELVRFLMRGMPVPATFGYPGTDGSWLANYVGYLSNINPVVSPFLAHPMHPFSRVERAVVWYCSTIFLFAWSFTEEASSAFDERALDSHRDASRSYLALARRQELSFYGFVFVRFVAVILYAVLIRQLCICPCLYRRVIDDLHREIDADATERHAAKLVRRKKFGDAALVWLAVAHTMFIGYVVAWVCARERGSNHVTLSEVGRRWALNELKQQAFNLAWQSLLFLGLFPVHRSMWFCGGSYRDYLCCRRRACAYARSPNFRDVNFPRCVSDVPRGAVEMIQTDAIPAPDSPRGGRPADSFKAKSYPVDVCFV